MNILKRLAIKNLIMNKKRTVSTIIGIILSTALICGTATLVSSFQKTLIQNAINETGYYHVKLEDIREEEKKSIESNRDIENIFETEEIGYGILNGSQNDSKPYIKLYSMSSDIANKLNFKIIEGRFAKNKNEIVVSNHIITNAEVKLKVGDKIKLNIGERKSLDDFDLNRT